MACDNAWRRVFQRSVSALAFLMFLYEKLAEPSINFFRNIKISRYSDAVRWSRWEDREWGSKILLERAAWRWKMWGQDCEFLRPFFCSCGARHGSGMDCLLEPGRQVGQLREQTAFGVVFICNSLPVLAQIWTHPIRMKREEKRLSNLLKVFPSSPRRKKEKKEEERRREGWRPS